MRFLASALLLALTACAIETDDGVVDATLTVQNRSDFAIVDIRLTPVDNPSFGPNLLGGDVLLPGEDITLGADCGTFDGRVTDEDGVQCDLFDLDLCRNDAVWVFTNQTCPVFAAARKAAAEQAAR